MKKIILLLLFLVTASVAFGAKFRSDELLLGKDGSAADKVIKFGSERWIQSNETSNKFEMTEDGGQTFGVIATLDDVGAGGSGISKINVISNPSFESAGAGGFVVADWSPTGPVGATITHETFTGGSPGDTRFLRYTTTVGGQAVAATPTIIPDNFGNRDCMAEIETNQGAVSFIFQVTTPTGILAQRVISDTGEWQQSRRVEFKCPPAGETLQMIAIASEAGTLDLNNAVLSLDPRPGESVVWTLVFGGVGVNSSCSASPCIIFQEDGPVKDWINGNVIRNAASAYDFRTNPVFDPFTYIVCHCTASSNSGPTFCGPSNSALGRSVFITDIFGELDFRNDSGSGINTYSIVGAAHDAVVAITCYSKD